jgi:nitroreductase
MMEFEKVVRRRRMVRHFKPDPVERATIERILDLARRVPSAGYSQGQTFLVVTDLETRRKVARLCEPERSYVESFGYDWVAEAPVQIVACTDEAAYHARYREPDKLRPDGSEIEWPIPFWYVDAGFAVMTLLLAVVNEGLAAGYAGVVDRAGLHALLGIPDDVIPVGVIPVGHPDQDIPSPSLKRGRRPLETLVHWDRW